MTSLRVYISFNIWGGLARNHLCYNPLLTVFVLFNKVYKTFHTWNYKKKVSFLRNLFWSETLNNKTFQYLFPSMLCAYWMGFIITVVKQIGIHRTDHSDFGTWWQVEVGIQWGHTFVFFLATRSNSLSKPLTFSCRFFIYSICMYSLGEYYSKEWHAMEEHCKSWHT